MLRELYRHSISVARAVNSPILGDPPSCRVDSNEIRPTRNYTRHEVAASELRSLSQRRQRRDDEWLQVSSDARWSMQAHHRLI
jgi:hypothetical protein